MKKRSAGSTRAVYDCFGKVLDMFGVVCAVRAIVVDQSSPSTANADYAIAFPQCANSDGAYCRIKSGDISATSENSNCPFACHFVKYNYHLEDNDGLGLTTVLA
jgi:hypothetical protein